MIYEWICSWHCLHYPWFCRVWERWSVSNEQESNLRNPCCWDHISAHLRGGKHLCHSRSTTVYMWYLHQWHWASSFNQSIGNQTCSVNNLQPFNFERVSFSSFLASKKSFNHLSILFNVYFQLTVAVVQNKTITRNAWSLTAEKRQYLYLTCCSSAGEWHNKWNTLSQQ